MTAPATQIGNANLPVFGVDVAPPIGNRYISGGQRFDDVYWYNADACRHKGESRSECALMPDHDGVHWGNGQQHHSYDGMVPYGPLWWGDDGKLLWSEPEVTAPSGGGS